MTVEQKLAYIEEHDPQLFRDIRLHVLTSDAIYHQLSEVPAYAIIGIFYYTMGDTEQTLLNLSRLYRLLGDCD